MSLRGNQRGIRRFLETKENDVSQQDLLGTVQAVLRGMFIALQTFIRKEERAHINTFNVQLKKLAGGEERNNKTESKN